MLLSQLIYISQNRLALLMLINVSYDIVYVSEQTDDVFNSPTQLEAVNLIHKR